jgi:hypothetical protein
MAYFKTKKIPIGLNWRDFGRPTVGIFMAIWNI